MRLKQRRMKYNCWEKETDWRKKQIEETNGKNRQTEEQKERRGKRWVEKRSNWIVRHKDIGESERKRERVREKRKTKTERERERDKHVSWRVRIFWPPDG
jgi:hypothetical protein